MHAALIKYSVLRLALFVGSLVLLSAVGVRRSILLLVLAAGISLALSYLLLGRQRDAVAVALSERISGRLDRRQGTGIGRADADEEDAAVDATALETARSREARSDRQADGQ